MSDWADRDAREIIGWAIRHGGSPDLPGLIAAKLRVIRSDGVGEGIERTQKIVDECFKPGAKPLAPSQIVKRVQSAVP